MLFVIIGLVIAIASIVAIVIEAKKEKNNSIMIFAVLSLVALVIIAFGVGFEFYQNDRLEHNFLKVSGIITTDEEGYPQTHFVNLYENIETEKLYEVKDVLGIDVYTEVEANNEGTPIVVYDEGIPCGINGPVYSVK